MLGSVWNEAEREMKLLSFEDIKAASAVLSKAAEREDKIQLRHLHLLIDGLSRTAYREQVLGFFQRLDAFEKIGKFYLTLKDLTDEAVVQLTKSFIPRNKLISELHLRIEGGQVTDYGLRILCERLVQELLLREGCLSALRIISCPQLTTAGCDELARFIQENHGFVRLDAFALHSCQRVGVEGCKYLLNSLVKNAQEKHQNTKEDEEEEHDLGGIKARELSLHAMSIGNVGAGVIAKSLGALTLTSLNVSQSKIHESGCVQLFQTLRKEVPQLLHLDVSYNHCGDRGLRALGKWIHRGSFLESLKLVAVKSSVREFEGFLSAWDSACYNRVSHLELLDISENGLGDGVVSKLVDTISMRTCALRKLCYNENSMTDEGAEKWARLFQSQRMLLKTVEGTDGYSMQTLKRKLKRMNSRPVEGDSIQVPFFEALQLKDNYLTSYGAAVLAAALRQVESDHSFLNPFRELDLSGNRIGIQGASRWKSYFLARPESCFPFEFTILPDDVQGIVGVNHLLTGCKQAGPNNLQGFQLLLMAKDDEFGAWMKDMGLVDIDESTLDDIFFKRTVDKAAEFKVNLNLPSHQSFQRASDATHTNKAFNLGSNGKVEWAKWVWDEVQSGYSAMVSNALHRLTYLMLVRERARSALNQVDFNSVGKIGVLVSLWEQLIVRKQKKHKGLCMLEFVLKHGAAPLLDIVLQLKELFGMAFKTQSFLSYTVQTQGKTVLALCMECHDPAVREWVVKEEIKTDKFL